MKKIIMLLLASVMILFGCSSAKASEEMITLTFMSWTAGEESSNSMEWQMIHKYEEMNPNINIEVINTDWNNIVADLTNAAAAGDLPDVFNMPSIPDAIANGWLLDITPYVSDEYDNVAAPLKELTTYEGQIIAVPQNMQISGYWANNAVVEAAGLTPIEYNNYDQAQWENQVMTVHDPANGVVGMTDAWQTSDLYTMFNGGTVFGAYDMESGAYVYDTPLYIEGVEYSNKVFQYSYAALTEEEMIKAANATDIASASSWGAWMAGNAGMNYDGTWSIANNLNAGIELAFLGVPGGGVVVSGDCLGIGATTEHPEEAVAFAEFMGYAGYATQIELATADPSLLVAPPAVTSQENIDGYMSIVGDIPGLEEALLNVTEKGVLNPAAYVPGYQMSRYDGETGIAVYEDGTGTKISDMLGSAMYGNIDYAEHASTVQEVATTYYNEASAKLAPAPSFEE